VLFSALVACCLASPAFPAAAVRGAARVGAPAMPAGLAPAIPGGLWAPETSGLLGGLAGDVPPLSALDVASERSPRLRAAGPAPEDAALAPTDGAPAPALSAQLGADSTRLEPGAAQAPDREPIEAARADEIGPGKARGSLAAAEAARARSADGAGAEIFDGNALARALPALRAAAADDYVVSILRKPGPAGPDYVVVLGERHEKTPEAAELGRAVLAHFDRVGREGYDPRLTPLRRLQAWAESLKRSAFARVRDDRQQPRREGSTIDELDGEYFRRAVAQALRSSFSEEKLRELLSELESASAEKLDASIVTMETAAGIPIRMPAREFLGLLRREGRRTVEPASTRLERGHRPDWRENLLNLVDVARSLDVFIYLRILNPTRVAWALLAGLAGLGAWAAAWLLGLALLGLGAKIVAATGLLMFAYSVASDLVTKFSLKTTGSPRWNRILPWRDGNVFARDRTMADNIARDASGTGPFLAIVGKAHVPGIRERLIRRHGYEEVALPDAPPAP